MIDLPCADIVAAFFGFLLGLPARHLEGPYLAITTSTYKGLTRAPVKKQLIDREIKKANEALSRVEQVKKFTILPKKLYEKDGEMTPTMKVKRKFINEAFADLIEAMN